MQIALSPSGPPMWFLGSPKQVRVSLNFANPGPVEVDFDMLDDSECQNLLASIRDGVITSDIPFQDLHRRYLQKKGGVETPVPDQKENPYVAEIQRRTKAMQEERNKVASKRLEKEEKLLKHCKFLAGQPYKGVLSAVNNTKDLNFLNILAEQEIKNKRRLTILKAIDKKRTYLAQKKQAEIDRKVARAMKSKHTGYGAEAETIKFDVIESEKETIVLTPEDLLTETVKESLGGVD